MDAFPKVLNLEGYKYIFNNDTFLKSYLNSILITVLGTLIGLSLTALTAYPISRREVKGKSLFMDVNIFTMVFNAGTIPSYLNMLIGANSSAHSLEKAAKR